MDTQTIIDHLKSEVARIDAAIAILRPTRRGRPAKTTLPPASEVIRTNDTRLYRQDQRVDCRRRDRSKKVPAQFRKPRRKLGTGSVWTPAKRRAISKRMKHYWAARRREHGKR